MRTVRLPGVFSPISDSWLLAERAADRAAPGVHALDLCTGSGVVAVASAQQGATVTAVDLSRRALATTVLNARLRRCRVSVLRGHLFEPVVGRTFDLVTANPPYVPSTTPRPRGATRAWAGGRDGRVLLDQICDRAARHVRPGGSLLLVQSSLIGEEPTLDRLARSGFEDVSIVDRRPGPLGPLMLEGQVQGLVGREEAEDVIVVRAAKT